VVTARNVPAVILLLILVFLTCGCTSTTRNTAITVTSLDDGDFPYDTVGNFDVYTGSFLIANPSNATAENINVNIMISPTAAYCHGQTATFDIPRMDPHAKKTVRASIAEFSGLDCQYNYTYQVVTRTSG
jgi:hypothetical protein